MLTGDGHVSEGSGENIFMVEDGRLITPPPSDNILLGITRDTVIRAGRATSWASRPSSGRSTAASSTPPTSAS